jgi:hypothetical protein
MEQEYKRAINLTLQEKRLWPAALLAALALSEAWWVVFDWGPQYLGERWERAVGDLLGDVAAFFAFVLAALAAFVVLKALGYLGEMVLVRQVADGEGNGMPTFGDAFSTSQHRYIPFAVTLLPYDALFIAAIYLPAVFIPLWDRWDPKLNQVFLYLLVMLLWFCLFLAVYFLGGITAALAARFTLIRGSGLPDAWRQGWELFRTNPGKCLAVWLQVLLAEIIFFVIAWPLSALLPWGAEQLADPIGFAPLRWLIYLVAYAILAGGLVIMQTGVMCFKSSLWTLTWLELEEEAARTEAMLHPQPDWFPEPPSDFMPPG